MKKQNTTKSNLGGGHDDDDIKRGRSFFGRIMLTYSNVTDEVTVSCNHFICTGESRLQRVRKQKR